VNGDRIADSRDLARKVAELTPNSNVDVRILRNNKEQTVKVKLGTFPGSKEEIARLEQGKSSEAEVGSLGLSLTPAKSARGGKAEGVEIADIDPDSNAATKGLKQGDVILEVNSQPVSTPEEVETAVKAAKGLGRKAVLLTVKSNDQRRIVGVQMKG
jgi:serine protease Do